MREREGDRERLILVGCCRITSSNNCKAPFGLSSLETVQPVLASDHSFEAGELIPVMGGKEVRQALNVQRLWVEFSLLQLHPRELLCTMRRQELAG